MPAHLKLRVAWQFKDMDAKNQAVINPCFRAQWNWLDPTAGTDAQALCNDLATALDAWDIAAGGQLTVTAYDLQGAKPNYPKAKKVIRPDTAAPVSVNPETCAVLSFFGARNVPRERGRLYIPAFIISGSGAVVGGPLNDSTIRTKVGELVPIFANLGGANIDWIVWSTLRQAATRVENWFIKDTWGVQRSRRLKSTSRLTGTTSG